MLQFMGLQRVRHDWATKLNWTELNLSHVNLILRQARRTQKIKRKCFPPWRLVKKMRCYFTGWTLLCPKAAAVKRCWDPWQKLAEAKHSYHFTQVSQISAFSICWKEEWQYCREEANCDSMFKTCFLDLLSLLQSYSLACVEDPVPLLDCKLKCLCSAPGETVCPCLPVNRWD